MAGTCVMGFLIKQAASTRKTTRATYLKSVIKDNVSMLS